MEITSFNVSSLIDEVVNLIKPQAKLKDIELINASSGNDLSISSDQIKLKHILQNLYRKYYENLLKSVKLKLIVQKWMGNYPFRLLIQNGISDKNIDILMSSDKPIIVLREGMEVVV